MSRTAALLLVALLVGAGCGGGDGDGDGDGEADQPRAEKLAGVSSLDERFAGVPQDGAALGSASAPWTLVEFADLQCPFCAQFDRKVLPALIERFVRPGHLRLVLRPVAFLGADSPVAAAAAVAASFQDRMWQFTDLFYRNQGQENSGYVTPQFLGRIANAVPGLDVDEWQAQSDTPELVETLDENARAAQTARIAGTPAFRLGRTGGVLAPFEAPVGDREGFLDALRKATR